MSEQLILSSIQNVHLDYYYSRKRDAPAFCFPFELPHSIKSEVALHSIYFPKFEIPILYRLYFVWNSNLHGVAIKFSRALISTKDIIYYIYENLYMYFKTNYPADLKNWEDNAAEDSNGLWPMYYSDYLNYDVININYDELPIKIITTENELEETKRVAHNAGETYHFMEPSITQLFDQHGGYINKVSKEEQAESSYDIHHCYDCTLLQIGFNRDTSNVVKLKAQSITTALVKCNLIESSLHNNKWEKIMDVAILNGENPYNKVEFNNLTFHKTTVDSSIGIVLRLETLDGNFIPFDMASPIIFKLILR